METLKSDTSYQIWAEGLNRTMQYGNNNGGQEEYISYRLFKSYYVVWKQFYSDKFYSGNFV